MKSIIIDRQTNFKNSRIVLFFCICSFLGLIGAIPLNAQESRTISGTVTSKIDGKPLIGVTVLEKGTNNGTVTNLEGKYTIDITGSSDYLVFSFIGLISQEKPVASVSVIDVSMDEDRIGLDEVVTIGYGSRKKSDLTGSVSSIRQEDISKLPVTSIDQSLQGKVAGVQVVQLSAQPGGATSIRIRGGNSIYAGNEPLWVIDGMVVESNNNWSWLSSPDQNGFGSLNANDIESIEILKDASATSIYGARGANGVVLVTTKRGKKGQDIATIEHSFGIQKQLSNISVLNAEQFAILFDEAGLNSATDRGLPYTAVYPDPVTLGTGTDWQKEIYRIAPTSNTQISFSGGDDKTQYAISGNYFSQDGIIYGSDFKRYTGRVNLDRQLNKSVKVGSSISISRNDAGLVGSSTPGGFFPGVVNTALTISPVMPVRDSTGQYSLDDPYADAWLDNPVAVTREVVSEMKTFRVIGNVFGVVSLHKNLDLKVSFGIDENNNTQDYYMPSYIYSGSFNGGQARYAKNESTSYTGEALLTWEKKFSEQSKLNILGGFSEKMGNSRSFINIATGFPSDRLRYYGISSAENKPTIMTGFNEDVLISYIFRTDYTIKDRYLFTLSDRLDGSSKFGPNNRFANFPAFAAAWRLSEEDFIKELNIFSTLKLRTSFGISGNDKIYNYQYLPTMSSVTYYFNGAASTGYTLSRPGNNDLKWETTRQFDAGIDMGFFNSRIFLVADYYRKYTRDMLYYAMVPGTSGFTNTLLNVGTMENKGFEFGITTVNLDGPAFKWKTDLHLSFNRNKIFDLHNNDATYINNDEYKLKIGNWAIIKEGEEMGTFFGFVSDGIWQSDEADTAVLFGSMPGDFKYVDQNGDHVIDSKDRVILGHAQPRGIISFNNTLSYRNIELSIFANGVFGNKILNANRFELESGNGLSNASDNMLNRWTIDNPSDIYPRANKSADYLKMSDRYLENGSYFRIQLVTLAYSIPKKWISRLKINNLKIYTSVKNAMIFTNYTGFDPEVGTFGQDNTRLGYDYGAYPSAITYLGGLKLDF